jgi:Cu/Ag efflux protein CusF
MKMERLWQCASRTGILGATMVVALTALAALPACEPSSPAPTTQSSSQVMELRGVIEKLPTAEAPRKLTIHHEATKDMMAMTMDFTADPAVSLSGLAVGDYVAFTYEINRTQRIEHITKLEKIPRP